MNNQVQETNDYSTASKLSMVTKGYFHDKFIKFFVPSDRSPKSRSPLIHLGYYVRAVVMNESLKYFINELKVDYQIVSLGAGYDTTYFRLSSELQNVTYFELDLRDVVFSKIDMIKNSDLYNVLEHPKDAPNGLLSKNYCLLAQDMNNIEHVKNSLLNAGFRINKPTIFFSECAITYMDENLSRNILKWGSTLHDVLFLIYEQINPQDGFGQVMMKHFDSVGSPLKSVEVYQTKEDQISRFKSCGYEYGWSMGAFELFKNVLPPNLLEYAMFLEPFDEWEEWHLTSSHYTLSAGANGFFNGLSKKFVSSMEPNSNTCKSLISGALTPLPLSCWELDKTLAFNCYGHTAVPIWNSSAILVIGGFGSSSNGVHKRVPQLGIIFLGQEIRYITPPDVYGLSWDCLHHSCSVWSDSIYRTELLLYGGRTSPHKSVNTQPFIITILRLDPDDILVGARTMESSQSSPESRRRHTATLVNNSTFIFGGLMTAPNKVFQVFDDAWIISKQGRWEQCPKRPQARFSHSAASSGSQVFIVGGIGKNFQPLGDIWSFNTSGNVWTKFDSNTIPRYSHTCHVFNHHLLIIGGVNYLSEKQPGLCSLNISTLDKDEYLLPESSRKLPIMLHNHTSILFSDAKQICIIGGGGTCFSFGTAFNMHCIIIKLDALLKMN